MELATIKTLVIDDSDIVHTLLGKVFDEHPDILMVGAAFDGQSGVKLARELSPDVIIMDINMPQMSGLEAIEEIMAEKPTPIIVFSSASRDMVDLSFKAIELGAVDLVEKPSAPDLTSLKAIIEEKLIRTIRTFADFKVIRRFKRRAAPSPSREGIAEPTVSPVPAADRQPVKVSERTTVDARKDFFVIAVASSTGGPQMLRHLLSDPAFITLPVGVVVVQHLAEGFVEGFADWLGGFSVLPVVIAREGEPVAPYLIQVAPAGRHLGLDELGRFVHPDHPPLFGIRPSADVLFESLARHIGRRLVALVLSGMGSDGARALPRVKEHGGMVIAQDEESSLIFGMPKAAIETGLTDAVLNIRDMPEYLARSCGGKAANHAG
jgi:two-component system chemotaxis response regulator CheB